MATSAEFRATRRSRLDAVDLANHNVVAVIAKESMVSGNNGANMVVHPHATARALRLSKLDSAAEAADTKRPTATTYARLALVTAVLGRVELLAQLVVVRAGAPQLPSEQAVLLVSLTPCELLLAPIRF